IGQVHVVITIQVAVGRISSASGTKMGQQDREIAQIYGMVSVEIRWARRRTVRDRHAEIIDRGFDDRSAHTLIRRDKPHLHGGGRGHERGNLERVEEPARLSLRAIRTHYLGVHPGGSVVTDLDGKYIVMRIGGA